MSKKKILLYVGSFIIAITISILYFLSLKKDAVDDIFFEEYYSKIDVENNFYQNLLLQDYDITKSDNPYIPDGFHYVTGTVETGYVIEDENENQYVWVPCNSQNLHKKDFSDDPFIPISECWEENKIYQKFLKSSLDNGGFYVSRFETGIEDGNIVSKMNVETLVNVSRPEVQEKVDKMYTDKDFNIEIINGFAYDRMLLWASDDNVDNVEIIDTEIYPDVPFYTGRNSYKNIYDIFDDMFEITSENCLDAIVYRGFASVYISGLSEAFDNRFTGSEENGYKKINLSSRLVLYK